MRALHRRVTRKEKYLTKLLPRGGSLKVFTGKLAGVCLPHLDLFFLSIFALSVLTIMRVSFLALASFIGSGLAQSATSSGPTTEYTLSAENITAKFIPHGARITSLVVQDRDGNDQDVVVGYDDPNKYPHDTATNHTYFGEQTTYSCKRTTNTLRCGCWEVCE